MVDWLIENGAALLDGRVKRQPVCVAGGRVAAAPPPSAVRIDAAGLYVLPGIVDLHGDGFERQLMPRPGVRFDIGLALRETDRQMLVNGVTTAFHGVTVSWEPGLRSLDSARHVVEAVQALRPALGCDTRLHLRWETFALEGAETVLNWLRLEPKPILAFNDHTTNMINKGHMARKFRQTAERAGLSPEGYADLLQEIWSRREAVAAAIGRLAAAARENGNVLLAHDEASPAEREKFRALGARASEFPMTLDTAAAARAHGEHVILGAPNVVRGGSHNGALDAAQAVAAGLCTVLASDYFYPAPLHAAFKLAGRNEDGLAAAWALVSANPAAVTGLEDRGGLSTGKRADLLLVDASDAAHPRVVAVLVEGRLVYSAMPLAACSPSAAAAA